MSFVRDINEIKKRAEERETADFGSAEMINVFWETKPEVVERLLPPPLKPTEFPFATAFVANYPETNFGLPYLETALFIRAEHNGIPGNYCLAMHLDGSGKDLAMAGGREHIGFPKKLAKIHFEKDIEGKKASGWSERVGTRNLEVNLKITGKFNDKEAPKILVDIGLIPAKMKNPAAVAYNFKHFWAPEGNSVFDYNPRLIKQETIFRPNLFLMGEAEIKLGSSIHDPWAEVEIVRVLGGMYQEGNNSMLRGSVVAEVDPGKFLPYAFLKWDWY